MRLLQRLRLFLRDLIARDAVDRDLDSEFAFHLEMETEANLQRGMTREEAECAARRSFGNARRHRQASRDARGWQAVERTLEDIRHALRTFRRHPGFAVTATITLALGLGATTAIFSVLDGVLLRPLPYPDGDRIVRIGWDFGGGGTVSAVSPLKFRHLADGAGAIASLSTRRSVTVELGEETGTPPVRGQRVSASFFDAMRVAPVRGRAFTAEEATSDAAVVVLSHQVWQTRFGGDPDLLGTTIPLNGEPHTVIGVMPEGFELVDEPGTSGLFLPFRFSTTAFEERGNNYTAIGRLAPGATHEAARAELAVLGASFRDAYPDRIHGAESYMLSGYLDPFVSDRLRTALWGFLAAAGFVLLVACMNVVSLQLARARVREREFSLRAVLGAPAGRLARQILTESFVLAALAAVIGTLLAVAALKGFLTMVPAELPRAESIGLDLRVVGFTALVAALTAFLAGLPAAIPAVRVRLLDGLGDRTGSRDGQGEPRIRRLLVATQIATSFVLLAGAGVLFASLRNLTAVDLGFHPEGLYSIELDRSRGPVPEDAAAPESRLERELLPALRALPGVTSVALSASAPLERGLNFPASLVLDGEEQSRSIELRAISPDYFGTLPVPLAWGRAFTGLDAEGAEPVAIINRSLADLVADRARGATLRLGRFRGEDLYPVSDFPPRRVIGVVDDVREVGPDSDPRPTAYVPMAQVGGGFSRYGLPRVLLRTEGSPPPVETLRAEAVRLGFVRDLRLRPATELRAATIAADRFNAALMGTFALVAALITAVGLYGFLAYVVSLRRREAGIRLAMGATPRNVLGHLTRTGLAPVAVGLVLGLGLTVLVSRVLAVQLFEVSPLDPGALAAATVALIAIALVASLVPARRATRVDPAGLLRHD